MDKIIKILRFLVSAVFSVLKRSRSRSRRRDQSWRDRDQGPRDRDRDRDLTTRDRDRDRDLSPRDRDRDRNHDILVSRGLETETLSRDLTSLVLSRKSPPQPSQYHLSTSSKISPISIPPSIFSSS